MGKKNKRKSTSTSSLDDDNEEKSTIIDNNSNSKQQKKKKCNEHEKASNNHEINVKNNDINNTNQNNIQTKKDIDEIDELFAIKKETQNAIRKQEEEDEKKREEQRKLFRKNNSNNTSSNIASSMFAKNVKNIELSQDKSDLQKLSKGEWANDGLGGMFDSDGYTGRKEEGSGYKIYKAHLFNKKGFGTTKDCPFDCDCCYI